MAASSLIRVPPSHRFKQELLLEKPLKPISCEERAGAVTSSLPGLLHPSHGEQTLCGLWGAEGAAWGCGRWQGSSTQIPGHSWPHAHPGEAQLDGVVEPSFAGHGKETKLLPPSCRHGNEGVGCWSFVYDWRTAGETRGRDG